MNYKAREYMDVHLLLNMWVCLKKWYPKIPVACYHCQYENAISSWYSGWWLRLKNMRVSWDDEIPTICKVIQNSMVPVTTNQP